MNNEQNNYQSNDPVLPSDTRADICKMCGQNSCACPNKNISSSDHGRVATFNETVSQEDKLEHGERPGEKKPPKIRWV